MTETETDSPESVRASCPFCGGTDIPVHHDGTGSRYPWLAWCRGCGVYGPRHATEAEAAEAWNRRAPSPAVAIRPLEWQPDEPGSRVVKALACGHRYFVGPCGGEPEQWQWVVDYYGARSFANGKAATADAAKAAAQADFEARVRARLAPIPDTERRD